MANIDKKDFEKIRKKLQLESNQREAVINKTREILGFSKRVIYSLHRSETTEAGKLLKKLRKSVNEVKLIARKNPSLLYSNSFKVAMQEYVEALAYYEFVKNKSMPKFSKLGVSEEHYLLGICDLTGELVRKAINSAIKGKNKEALEIKEFVFEIYGEMLKFEFSGELRKKFDSIKYNLQKLESLALDIKFKK